MFDGRFKLHGATNRFQRQDDERIDQAFTRDKRRETKTERERERMKERMRECM